MDTSKEFLNPSSMLTPGFAGAMTMAITNAVSAQFAISAPGPAYLGLALSFVFGLLVWASQDTKVVERCVYYVLNSLIVFVVAVGSNTVGRAATATPSSPLEHTGAISGFFVSNALAQTTEKSWCCIGDKINPATREECNKWDGKLFPTEDAAKRACTPAKAANEPAKDSGFFRAWVRAKSA